MAPRDPAIVFQENSQPSDPAQAAALIFLHGLGDDATSWQHVATQFQSAQKLPHLKWIFPNALINHDAMQTAWYTPTPLTPFPSQRPELDDLEDEDGLLQSVEYVETLIDELVEQGLATNRIVVGGFSQGCAVALLTGLVSKKYAGGIAGVIGLAGYLPIADKVARLRAERNLPKEVGELNVLLTRGNKDMLVPRRYSTIAINVLKVLGAQMSEVELKEYEGLGHSVSGQVLRDVCTWLEQILPSLA